MRDSFKEVSIGVRESIKRAAACASLACILAVVNACSSHAGSNGNSADVSSRAQESAHTDKTAARVGRLSFNLVNFTGSTLRAVYVSPSDSKGWEENILGVDQLKDGDTLDVKFSPEESTALWDIKVESADEHYAEWKSLDLRGVSRVTLLLKQDSKSTAVAEIE